MTNKAQLFWDKRVKRFDDSETQFDSDFQVILAKTREYLNETDTVLDFGCATGTKTLHLADGIRHIHGLDFSAGMISEAIKKKDKAGLVNVSFSQGTIYSTDLEKAAFDKIVAYAIIHLLKDSEKAIQRIHELLKPGGLFISATPCFKDRMSFKTRLGFIIPLFMARIGMFPLHLNMYKTSDLEQYIRNQNFNILKAETLFNGMTIDFIVAEKY